MSTKANIENIVLDTLVQLYMNSYDSYTCARAILPMLQALGYHQSDIIAAIEKLSSKNYINIQSVSQNPASEFKCISSIPITKHGFEYWEKYC